MSLCGHKNSKWTKMCHYKPRDNVQSGHWPDVFGLGATNVSTWQRYCVRKVWIYVNFTANCKPSYTYSTFWDTKCIVEVYYRPEYHKPECCHCVHTWRNKPHQGAKWTRVRSKQTKHNILPVTVYKLKKGLTSGLCQLFYYFYTLSECPVLTTWRCLQWSGFSPMWQNCNISVRI